MKDATTLFSSIEKACYQVFAHALSRLRQSDINGELRRLDALPKGRRTLELAGFMGALFGLSILAASFGWIAFGAYFLAVLILFY